MKSSDFVMPSDPAARAKIKVCVKDAVDSLVRIEAEKDLMKNIADELKEELGMPPSLFKFLVRTYHKQDADKKQTETEEMFDAYDMLFKSSNAP